MEHPIFLSISCCSPGRVDRESAREARSPTPGPTCQAAECVRSCGGTLAQSTPQAKGGIQMAKKAKGGKKKAAKKR